MQSQKKKALIVEGDRLTGREVAAVLGNAGLLTVEVGVHEDPLLSAEMAQPNVIIIDTTAPDVDGFAIFKSLRDSHQTGTIPIIALVDRKRGGGVDYTGDDFEAAFDVRGPEGIVEKPINSGYLVTCVMGVLG